MQKKVLSMLFSPLIIKANKTQKLAYIGVMTALSIVSNMLLEVKFYDIQFSLTIAISCIIGVLLGAVCGFVACFVGDLVGFLVNSWGSLYMPWVGLSSALFAFIAGFIINGFSDRKKYYLYIKISVLCLITFLICTIGINSTGFYLYNQKMGFSTAVINYVNNKLGSDSVGYFGYILYRLIFKGQIYNSLANYVLIFVFLPIIMKNKKLRNLEDKYEDRT